MPRAPIDTAGAVVKELTSISPSEPAKSGSATIPDEVYSGFPISAITSKAAYSANAHTCLAAGVATRRVALSLSLLPYVHFVAGVFTSYR